MRYFPIFCDMRGQTVFIAGGGAVAANKVRLYARTEGAIRVVAPSFNEEIAEFAASGRITVEKADPALASFGDAVLVIAATESEADKEIARRAKAEGYLVNVVDKTELCSFITPSIVDRGKVVVAIGTEGAAPVLARRLRERIEALLPERLGALAALIGDNRERLEGVMPFVGDRRSFWEAVVDGSIAAELLAGNAESALAAFENALAAAVVGKGQPERGGLHVVICPPEDDLLTLRDLRALQDADVILTALGVSECVLDKARRDAERKAAPADARSRADALREEAVSRGLNYVLLLPHEEDAP